MARGLLSRNLPIAGLALAAAALALGQASSSLNQQQGRPSGTPDVPTAGSLPLPHRAAVLAAGQRAFQAWALERPQYNVGPDFNCSEGMECNDCHWTGSTFLLGVMEWHRATADPHALAYAQRWAEYYDYTVCGEKSADSQGPDGLAERQPRLRHNINHQLSGAIYAELSALDNNETHLHSVAELLGAEMADPSTDNFWSWVDAIHMAMNTWARMGNLTGDRRYFAKQFANFNASALTAANGRNKSDTKDPTATAFGFWNASEQLFYRDTRFLGTDVFWSRGNGWALGALVAGLRYGASADPHYGVYLRLFSELAAKLARLQPKDGAWRASLLDPSGYPTPETSGTAEFTFGIAWGINNGLLPAAEFTPVVASGWAWLAGTALHSNGLVGFCQPGGDQPENNFNSSSTTNFCVGQFLLAAGEVLKLVEQQTVGS